MSNALSFRWSEIMRVRFGIATLNRTDNISSVIKISYKENPLLYIIFFVFIFFNSLNSLYYSIFPHKKVNYVEFRIIKNDI